MSIDQAAIRNALNGYCNAVRQTRQDPAHHPETSLYTHFELVIRHLAAALGYNVEVIQQYQQHQIGAPDFGIRVPRGIVSFVEAKAPDKNLANFTGHDQAQFERYKRLPNLIYTNYWELDLYQNGELKQRAELVPPQCLDFRQPLLMDLSVHDVMPAVWLLQRFFTFETSAINSADDLAYHLAPAAWLVRDAVREALETGPGDSPLHQIYHEFRDVLFYELDSSGFADAYAQTLAYGLLLARQATQAELTPQTVASFIDRQRHRLLSATLMLLSQPQVVQMVGWTINNLIALVNSVSSNVLLASVSTRDPLLYFYEDFLEIYDPELRKRRGVYYTPPEVVNLQTRVINHLLINSFGRRYGFADETVQTLDPAVGTGTYLVSALNQGCQRIEHAMGADSIADAASVLGNHLHGFEVLVGPYTVAHFRLASAIQKRGGQVRDRLPILLTNTLLAPQDQPNIQTQFAFMSGPLTEERLAADQVKGQVPVMVIFGNPPYRRARAEVGWVWNTLLDTFREPVRAEYSIDFKNLADLYVLFYRWAIWKLFEAESAPKRGVLSFISNSKWILGGAFGGMRQVFRQYFDRIYIIDLHGDNRAALPAGITEDQNIFDIQVGVAISICVADGSRSSQEAEVYYYGTTWGTREEKYAWLDQVSEDLSNVSFEPVEGATTDPFFPNLDATFKSWPTLNRGIFLYKKSGVQTKRDHLVVAPTEDKLREKIESFLNAPVSRQAGIFHETRDKAFGPASQTTYHSNFVREYGYRPLDVEYLYNHSYFVEYNRANSLQKVWGRQNIALHTLSERESHGAGPVVFLHHRLPDMVGYKGSCASYVFPLWDNRRGSESRQSLLTKQQHNLNHHLLVGLQAIWGQEPAPQDVFAYCYAVLSAPSYSFQFSRELARSFPCVPFPRIWKTFQEGVELGQRLVRLHSFQDRYPADGSLQIHGAPENIEFANYDENEHRVNIASSAWVGPVSPEAWNYMVSGYGVLRQWLLRRREIPFNLALRQELLDVIWIIERTVELSGELDDLLSQLLEGETLTSEELGVSGGA